MANTLCEQLRNYDTTAKRL